jgi:hypothetical protein
MSCVYFIEHIRVKVYVAEQTQHQASERKTANVKRLELTEEGCRNGGKMQAFAGGWIS